MINKLEAINKKFGDSFFRIQSPSQRNSNWIISGVISDPNNKGLGDRFDIQDENLSTAINDFYDLIFK